MIYYKYHKVVEEVKKMYCSNCGNKQKSDEKYCTNCGTEYQKEEDTNVKTNNNSQGTISLVMGIIACVFFWLPILSIPFAIVSITLGNKYKKETNKKTAGIVLGIISIILSVLEIVFLIVTTIFFVNWVEENVDETEPLGNIYDYIEENIESFDIRGYSWIGDDQSTLYLNKDKTYTWYKDDSSHTDNFYIGTYEFYTGNNAIIYIADNLKEYGITEDEQKSLIRNGGYKLKDYYLIILNCNKAVIEGKEQTTATNTVYYYGFYKEKQKYLDLVNMNTSNYAGFTRKDKLSSIDL